MEKQSDNITLEVPTEALEALYNATVHYQDRILSIPPDERGEQLEQDFDIMVGLSEAFDHVLTERTVHAGLNEVVRGFEKLLSGGKQ